MGWWLCTFSNGVVVMSLLQWYCGYVFVAMVLWLCICLNGVVVMYWQLCGGYVLVAIVLWLCTCSNGVVVLYL